MVPFRAARTQTVHPTALDNQTERLADFFRKDMRQWLTGSAGVAARCVAGVTVAGWASSRPDDIPGPGMLAPDKFVRGSGVRNRGSCPGPTSRVSRVVAASALPAQDALVPVAHFPFVVVGAGVAGRAAVAAFDTGASRGRLLLVSRSVPAPPTGVAARIASSRPVHAVDDDLFHPDSPLDPATTWRQCLRRPNTTPGERREPARASSKNWSLWSGWSLPPSDKRADIRKEVCYQLGLDAVRLDTDAHLLGLSDGSVVSYGCLLLATGRVNLVPPLLHATVEPSVVSTGLVRGVRSRDDWGAILRAAELGGGRASIAIIGTGPEPLRVATTIAHSRYSTRERRSVRAKAAAGLLDDPAPLPSSKDDIGAAVTVMIPEPAPMATQLPRYLSAYLAKLLRASGINLECFSKLHHVGPANAGRLTTASSSEAPASSAAPEPAPVGSHRRVAAAAEAFPRPSAFSQWQPRCTVSRVSAFDVMKSVTEPFDLLVVAPTRVPARTALAKDGMALPGIPPPAGAPSNGLVLDTSCGGIATTADLVAADCVYAAGAVAASPTLPRGRTRAQSLEGAFASGTAAGRNMLASLTCGSDAQTPGQGVVARPAIPSSRVLLPGVGVSMTLVGQVDSSWETYGFWETAAQPRQPVVGQRNARNGDEESPEALLTERAGATAGKRGSVNAFRNGIVFYVDGDRVVGALVWERVPKVGAAAATEAYRWLLRPCDPTSQSTPSVAECQQAMEPGSVFEDMYAESLSGVDPAHAAEAELEKVSSGEARGCVALLRHVIRATHAQPLQSDDEMRGLLEAVTRMALDERRRQAAGPSAEGAAEGSQAASQASSPAVRAMDVARSQWQPGSDSVVRGVVPSLLPDDRGGRTCGDVAERAGTLAALAGTSTLAAATFMDGEERWRRLSQIEDAGDAAQAAARLRAKGELAAARAKTRSGPDGGVPSSAGAVAVVMGGLQSHPPETPTQAAASSATSETLSTSRAGTVAVIQPTMPRTDTSAPDFSCSRDPLQSESARQRRAKAVGDRIAASPGHGQNGQQEARLKLQLKWTQPRSRRLPDGGVDVLIPVANRSSQSRREAQTASALSSADNLLRPTFKQ